MGDLYYVLYSTGWATVAAGILILFFDLMFNINVRRGIRGQYLVQKPLYRTVNLYDKRGCLKNHRLPFPYIVYVQHKGRLHVFFAKKPLAWNSILYTPLLGNIYCNGSVCMSCTHDLEDNIRRFWGSSFTRCLDGWWLFKKSSLSHGWWASMSLEEITKFSWPCVYAPWLFVKWKHKLPSNELQTTRKIAFNSPYASFTDTWRF